MEQFFRPIIEWLGVSSNTIPLLLLLILIVLIIGLLRG